jgi:protein CpxP
MKKQMLLLFALLITGTIAVNAQGGSQRRTVEERVQVTHQKIDSAFKLDAAKQTQVDTVFAYFYRNTDKVREELMSGGERPDFQVMREKMQPYVDARDKELKVLFTEEQYKKWKEELEPAMMSRRGQGGGGNRQ